MENKLHIRFIVLFYSLLFSSLALAKGIDPVKTNNANNTSRYYPSSHKEGFIGVFDDKPLDSPVDNVFTVSIKELPAANEQVFLTYELYGITNHTGISRSINNQLSVGGYFVTQNSSWHPQEEQLKADWLKKGENSIRFTLPDQAKYNYRIRNLGIVIKKAGLQDRAIIVNQPINQEYNNDFGYIKGFVQGKGSTQAKVYIDGVQIKSLGSEFEALIPKKASHLVWDATLKIIYPEGQIIEKKLIYKTPTTSNFHNKIAVRSANSIVAEYTPEKAFQLEIKGAAIALEPQSLVSKNTISLIALRDVDLPTLDGMIVNVTKNYDGYRVTTHGNQFIKEAKISLEFDPTKIPEGYTEQDVKTYYFDEITKHWVALKKDSLQSENKLIISKLTKGEDLINGVIKVPESPETAGFTPTSIKDIKAANPSASVNTINPPSANNMGSANVGYPITLPAGRQGMQPQLGIDYNSSGGNDWLGMGWNLVIPSFGIDTRWGVPRYETSEETETYVMSGETLAPIAHKGNVVPRTTEKQFYPRVEGNFNKIIRHGSNPNNYWWEVTNKSGSKSFFGGTPSSGINEEAVLRDRDGNIAHWGLIETRDLNDNFVRYHYTKVLDTGIEGGSVMGYNNYVNKITYTGSGSSEGKYEVVFTRDRDLGETKRLDVTINARYGFKQVTADLLRKIEVKLNNEKIRSYELTYKEGAFYKTLLSKITEFDAAGVEFNHHDFDYFDDVKSNEGYQPYTATENWNPQDDNVKGDFLVRVDDFNDNASALSGNKTSGKGFGLALTVGPLGDTTTKSNTVGGNFGFSQSEGEGMLSLIDINGDNLPDKVYTKNGVINFRPNLSRSDGLLFGEEKTIFGIGTFSTSKTETYTYGIEAHFGVYVGLQKTDSKNTVKTYFCDANGDGLIDLVHNGIVYFNHLVNGIPTYTQSSADTPSPIGSSTTGIDPDLVQIDPQELERLKDQFPLHDVVRVWEAPYTGTITVNAPVGLNPNFQSIDGVRVAIQHKAIEIWNDRILQNDFTVRTPVLSAINVIKGDRIYFRVQSVENGLDDIVDWNPIVSYTQHVDGLIEANNLPIYQFKASDGFILSANQTLETPINGSISIESNFIKPITSDDVKVSIVKKDANGTSQVIWQNTFLANQVLNQPINLAINTLQKDTYSFVVSSDSNIDWKAIKWAVRVYYTASSDPAVTSVNNPDGTPILEFFPTINYELFAKSIKPTASWKAIEDGSITITPEIAFDPLTNPPLQAEIVLTIKKANTLLAKQKIEIQNNQPVNITPVTVTVLKDEILYFDLYTKDVAVAEKLITTKVNGVLNNGTNNPFSLETGLSTVDNSVIFGPLYQHWGQFGYNGNRERANQPINEAELTLETSNQGNIDISGTSTADQMEQSYQDQGGQKVSDAKFIMMLPDNVNQLWKGYDEKHWVAETKLSSSRLGRDDLTIENPATNGGTGARGIDKVTKSFSVGLSAGIGSFGGSTAIGDSKNTIDFTDLNGDRYPDIVSENKIQYTKANGTFETRARNVGTSYFEKSTNNSFGISLNGAPTLSKSMASMSVPIGTPDSTPVFDDNGNIVGATKEYEASRTTGSLGVSLSINNDESSDSFLDINGDGLPDKIYKGGDVALNLGYEFADREKWNFSAIRNGKGEDLSGGPGLGYSYGDNSISGGIGLNMSWANAQNAIQDFNGDGLPDLFDKDRGNVYLNTGNKFIQAAWSGIDNVQETVSVGESAHIAFTVCIPIPFLGIKICVNPSANVSHSASKEKINYSDIDGDGFPDILISKKDNELTVKRSTIARTNLLKEVKRPMGASFTIDYARIGNTYDQPSDVWALTKVTLNDGFNGDGPETMVSTFEYENGKYDRNERDFYGFKTVKSHQIDTQNSNTTYRTILQEFNNDNYYEKGSLIREALVDANSNLYTETINTFELKDIATGATLPESFKTSDTGKAFLASVKTQKNFYEGGSTAQKNTSMTYRYDVLGNIIGFTDFGDTDTDDDITSTISYHSVPSKYILGTPSSVIITSNGQTIRKSETSLNFLTGDITQIRKFLQDGTTAKYDLEYDNYGNLTKITRPENANGERLHFQYLYDPEVHTYTTNVSDGYGYSSSSTYDYKFGQMLLNTDLNGHQIRYEIDKLGRITTITGPFEIQAGKPYTIAFEYHPEAAIPWAKTKHYDPAHPNNNIETVTFIDGLSRAIQVKKDVDLFTAPNASDQENMTVSGRLMYDAFGRVLESYYPVSEPKGSEAIFNQAFDNITPTKTTYDVLNRALKITLPDGAVSDIGYGFGNDREGAIQFSTKATDANGIWKESYTNVRGLTKAVQEKYSQGSNIWTSFNYNAINELIVAKDDQNNEIKSTYDWLGRRTQMVHPDAGISFFEYDLANNIIKKLTANLKTGNTPVTYTYEKERLIAINYPNNPVNNVKYTYGDAGASENRAGRIALQEDASGAQEFFYNQLGAVLKNIRTILVPGAAPLTFQTEWKYDTWNRVTEMLYPDKEKVTYTYNFGGLLHAMKGVKAGTEYKYVTQLGYDKFEQRTYLSYGNGTETFYKYEPDRRRLQHMVAETAENRKMMDNVYTYDKVNNILNLKNNAQIPSSNLMGGSSDYNYVYDDLYRLTSATGNHKGSNQENRYTLAMKYNSIHSIVKKEQLHQFKAYNSTNWAPRNKTTYTYDYNYGQTQPHAPIHIGEHAYTYDANGNQTGWTDDVSGQQRQILWDEENRIKAIADNGQLFSYVYDAQGERVLKSNGGGQSVAINGSKKAGKGSIGNFTIYVNPYVVVRNSMVTKHFYIESQRVATKLTESNDGLLQTNAGQNKINYANKQTQLQEYINKQYVDLDIEKVADTVGNNNNIPPGQSGETPPQNGNNGNNNTTGNGGLNGNGNGGVNNGTTGNGSGGNGINKEAFVFYYHPDHLGSSSYISDANGEVTQHLEYFAFGETFLEEHSNTERTPYLFNSKELDEETGLYYYGARYYDPITSVWQSVDPLALYDPVKEIEHYLDGEHNGGVYNSGNLAAYSYTYQNPLRYIDPNGKQVDIVDFIPFAGSGRDIYRGIRDGDMLTLGIGVGGMILDVATLGSGSAIKGGVKAAIKIGVKEVAEQGAKQIVEQGSEAIIKETISKAEQIAINKAVGKAAEATVTKKLIEEFGEQNVKSQITARFKDGTAVVFDNVVLKDGKIVAINETKSGAAQLTKQQARFFEGGEAVKFVGEKAKDAEILGKEITNKMIKILRNAE
jgi:RHS repeat-associated protein